MCSIALNAILGADEEFLAMKSNDPLVFLTMLKRIVATKCDGHVEHDRTDALTEWYNLKMGDNEPIQSQGIEVHLQDEDHGYQARADP